MAMALVKAGTATSTATTSVTPTFGQSTAAGNLLIAWLMCGSSIGGTFSGPAGWHQAVVSSANADAAIWYKAVSVAGESNPAFNTTSSGITILAAVLAEFSTGATGGAVDQVGSGNSGSSPVVANAAAADAADGNVVAATASILLSKSGTNTTTDTMNNGATATSLGNNDSTTTNWHYKFVYGITTGHTSADQDSEAQSSMNFSAADLAIASFKPAASKPPRNPAINHQNPGLLMQRFRQRVRHHGRIIVPDLWLPEPAI